MATGAIALTWRLITLADLRGANQINRAVDQLTDKIGGDATQSYSDYTRSVNEATEATKKQDEETKKLQLSLSDLVLGYQQLGTYIRQAIDFLQEAASAQAVREEFQRLSAAAGLSAQEILTEMQEAAAGTISAQQMMANANRLLLSGLEIDARQMSQLLLIARDRARGMGISVQQAFDDIITGVTRSQPLILDNLGLIVKQGQANEQLAQQLGKTVEQLTEEEKARALLNQVLNDNAQGAERLRGEVDGMNDQLSVVETNLATVKDAFGAFFSETEAGQETVDLLGDAFQSLAQVVQIALGGLAGFSEFMRVVAATGGNLEMAMNSAEVAFETTMAEMLAATGQMEDGLFDATAEILNAANAVSLLRAESIKAAKGTGELPEQFDRLQAAINDVAESAPDLAAELQGLYERRAAGQIGAIAFMDEIMAALDRYEGEVVSTTATVEAAHTAAMVAQDAELEAYQDYVNLKIEETARLRDELEDLTEDIEEIETDISDSRASHLEKRAAQLESHYLRLESITTKGEQNRLDAIRDHADKVADTQQDLRDKLQDIATQHDDDRVDAAYEAGQSEIKVTRSYLEEIRRLKRQSDEAEEDAIRRRDAYALDSARKTAKEAVQEAADQYEQELTDEREALAEKQRQINQSQRRAERDATQANRRMTRDNQTWLERRLRDNSTAISRQINEENASHIRRMNNLQNQFISEQQAFSQQFARLLEMKREFAREFNDVDLTTVPAQRPVSDLPVGGLTNQSYRDFRTQSDGRNRVGTQTYTRSGPR